MQGRELDHIGFIAPESCLMCCIARLKTKMGRLTQKEADNGTGFLLKVAGIGAGVISYFQLDFEPSLPKLLALTLLTALLAYLARRWLLVSLSCSMVLAGCSGAIFAKLETERLNTTFITQEMTIPVTVRVINREMQAKGGYRLMVRVINAGRGAQAGLEGRLVRLSARALPPEVKIGSGLSGLVSLRPPSGPVRAGTYDFSFHNYYRAVAAQGFFMGLPQKVDIPHSASLIERLQLDIYNLRVKVSERIGHRLEGETGAIASALITGLRGGISEETSQALRSAGLAHILAISGLHMAMVSGMVLLIGRIVLGLFTHFSSRHAPRKMAALIALGFSGFYLLLSGADIAAQRSFIMVAVMLLAILFDRAALTLRNLGMAALIILIISPHEILSPGFQMSFAATATLITAFGWWSRRQAEKDTLYSRDFRIRSLLKRTILMPVLTTMVASVLAGSTSGLFAAYHFANVAPLGLVSNMAALPVMSLIVMPAALLAAMLIGAGITGLEFDTLPLYLMGTGVDMVKDISFWVADLTPDIMPGMISPLTLVLLSLALVIFLFLHSALRILALLPLLAGLGIHILTAVPVILIDEEARLVALATAEGKLALSHARANRFILDKWLPVFTLRQNDIILPGEAGGFSCHDFVCQAKMTDDRIFAMALGASGRAIACQNGDVILLNYMIPNDGDNNEEQSCKQGQTVISRRDLALKGAAMIYASTDGYQIEWAVGEKSRPWIRHRSLTKAALGFP